MQEIKMTKKPPIYLIIILPVLVGGYFLIVWSNLTAFKYLNGIGINQIPEKNALLILLPSFFLWVPVSLLLSNAIISVIPSTRKIAENYVKKANKPDYTKTQKALKKLFWSIASIAIPLILLGYLL